MVGPRGFEPLTFAVSRQRSPELSYGPIWDLFLPDIESAFLFIVSAHEDYFFVAE